MAEVTVVSAKHLKNVNWRVGDLKPCAVLYLDPDNRVTTKVDDSGSTSPVWNERLVLPVPQSADVVLNLEIFHSKPSETSKPLVAFAKAPLWDLIDKFPVDESRATPIRSIELRRPSGRPQGKIKIKVIVREIPLAPPAFPPPSFYNYSYASSPPLPLHLQNLPPPHPPPPASSHAGFNLVSYSDPYAGYYSGGYYSAPPLPPRPNYYGPSAPVDYTSGNSGHQSQRNHDNVESRSEAGVGAVSGAFGGMSLREGSNYEEKKSHEGERERTRRGDYSGHRDDY